MSGAHLRREQEAKKARDHLEPRSLNPVVCLGCSESKSDVRSRAASLVAGKSICEAGPRFGYPPTARKATAARLPADLAPTPEYNWLLHREPDEQ
jgi:hypothetical protein